MLIEKIRIVGLKWFNKSNIEDIEITMDELFQIIVGSNGAGKSSLIDKCLPCVGMASDFKEEGLLHYNIRHHGSAYELISEIKGKTTRHTFIRDGERLNDAGTGTVQKLLIEQEFNITPEIHKLLTGRSKFTVMPPTQTMNMLMRVSGLDLAYANGLFQTIKDRSRDCIGALKHIQTKIEDTTSRLASISTVDNVESTILELNERVVILTPIAMHPINDLNTDEQSLDVSVGKTLEACRRIKGNVDTKGYTTLNAMKSAASEQSGIVNSINTQLANLYAKLQDVGGNLSAMRNDQGDAVSLKAEIDETKMRLSECISDPDIKDINIISVTLSKLASIVDSIGELNLDLDSITRYNRDERQSTEEDLLEARRELVLVDSRIESDLNKIKLADSATAVNCSSCGADVHVHGSLPHETYVAIKQSLKDDGLTHIKLTDTIDDYTGLLYMYDEYDRARQAVNFVIQLAKDITGLIKDHDEVIFNHHNILIKCSSMISLWTKYKEHAVLSQRLDSLQHSLAVIESGKYNQLSVMEKDLESQIDKLKSEMSKSIEMRKDLLDNINIIEKLDTAHATISTYQTDMLARVNNKALKEVVELAKTERTRIIEQLGILQSAQSRKAHLESTLADLSSQEAKLIETKKDLDILSNTLSPKQGIIAEQMAKFMQVFFGKLNNVLGEIFNDGIKVVANSDMSKQDYKFPLEIAGFSQGTIADGSEGEQEVINLGFRIALMKTLDLDGYPLFLDETGANFDDTHRDNLIMFVKDILVSGQVSQIFMVSHYMAMHGAISNFNTIVLHGDNLSVIPPNANSHVIIK